MSAALNESFATLLAKNLDDVLLRLFEDAPFVVGIRIWLEFRGINSR